MRGFNLMAWMAAWLVMAGGWAQETLPVARVETVAQPVRTARVNAPTLALDAKGRWQFICQAMNYKGTTDFTYERRQVPGTERQYVAFRERDRRPDAEWIVLDLESGQSRIFELPGFHGGGSVRAHNGRVFFFTDFMQVWYFEPADGEMKILGEISRWVPFTNDRSFYKMQLGADGMIYATTQSYHGKTALVQIDPEALTWKVFGNVGANRPAGLTYGYYLGLGLPWVYVGVGQDHWELMAVNVETGEQRLLAERQGEGARVVVGDDDKGAVRAELIGDGKKEVVWCIDGATVPMVAGATPPRATLPDRKLPVLPEAPELDKERPVAIEGDGSATVWWRPVAGQGDWRSTRFQIKQAEPELIESLTVLRDGKLLGSVRQYNGWFRVDGTAGTFDYFGKGGPSRARTAILDGLVYFAGYPNCTMQVFDPSRPWQALPKPSPEPDANPRLIGSFGQGVTEAHYATVLLPGPNGRVYTVGKRERWSTGTGVGYYEVASGQRIGRGQDMKDYYAQGAVLLPELGRLVISGKGPDAAGQFRVYDLELTAQEPVVLKEGLASTGRVQGIGHPSRFLGYVEGETADALYLFDLAGKNLVAWQELPKPEAVKLIPGEGSWWAETGAASPSFACRNPADGSWWMIRGNRLCRLDVETLAVTPVAALDRHLALPVWSGGTLYGAIGGEVVRVNLPKP